MWLVPVLTKIWWCENHQMYICFWNECLLSPILCQFFFSVAPSLWCLRLCVWACYLWGVFHQTLPQQPRHHLQLLFRLLNIGIQLEDFLEVGAGWQVVLTRAEKIRSLNKSGCFRRMNAGFTAPLNPCEPGLVCRRPSCCWAPAAEQSRSPVWPLQSDSVSGSRWLWRRVDGRVKRMRDSTHTFTFTVSSLPFSQLFSVKKPCRL